MKTINKLQQGTEAWHQFRRNHFGASEAAAMLGLSPYMSRDQLLRQKATGEVPEVSAGLQRVFDKGHEVEAMARPIIEEMIGDDLLPVTLSDGDLSCSCDGLTIDDDLAMEHKQDNAELFASVMAGILPEHHQPQCQQVLMISGAKKLIFVVSNGTKEKMASMWVRPDPIWFDRIRAGWAQFAEDLNNYVPAEVVEPAVAVPTLDLPAVSVQVSGSIALISNLDLFGAKLTEFIGKINTKPEDDQSFADCEDAIKKLGKAEDALKAAESGALAQTASIDEMRRTVALYVDQARTTRLMLEKMVKQRKETIRGDIARKAQTDLAEHILGLNKRIGQNLVPPYAADFAGCMKGLKSLDSIRNAVNTELANAKIATSATADRIEINVKSIGANGFLFPDLQSVCTKSAEDFAALLFVRVQQQKEQEEKRIAERVAAEVKREKDRVEAEAKREADQKAQMAEHELLVAERAAQRAVDPVQQASAPMIAPMEIKVEQAVTTKPVIKEFDADIQTITSMLFKLNKVELAKVLHYIERLVDTRQSAA